MNRSDAFHEFLNQLGMLLAAVFVLAVFGVTIVGSILFITCDILTSWSFDDCSRWSFWPGAGITIVAGLLAAWMSG
jgi:hypothetical protein